MHIHIIPNEKFTNSFIELMIGENFKANNYIYVYRDQNFDIIKNDYVKEIKSFKEVDYSLLNIDDKVFVHSFYNLKLMLHLIKNKEKFDKNKLVLIIYGSEVYNNRYMLEKGGIHFQARLEEFFKKKLFKISHTFMTFACSDYGIAHKYYGADGEQFDCLYTPNINISYLDALKKTVANNKCVRILLGNSATDTNKHFEALDWLSRFSENDIEIICPLSYGNKKYGKCVIDYGKQLFGNKFIPILDYMTPEKYSELLNSVNVAVFNNNRQQGIQNIEILAYLGKKIYIRSDITSWDHYVVRDKCSFYDTKQIYQMSFEEFYQFTNEERQNNVNYFKKIWDINYVKSLWDEVIKN